MPLFEYECANCGKQFTEIVLPWEKDKVIACPGCSSKNIKKLVSCFSYHQSEQDRLSKIDTSTQRDDSYYKDDRNIGLWAKKRAQELGVDLGPKFEGVVEKARSGKILEEYDK